MQSLTLQLAFEYTLSDDIHVTHSKESSRSRKDTLNNTDGVSWDNTQNHLFRNMCNADNSMLAWKTVQITSLG